MNSTLSNQQTSATPIAPKLQMVLTAREQQIMYHIANELSDKEIGEKLFLSHHTVHSYRKSLMSKLRVRKSAGIVRRGFELGLLGG